jgi:hypothetical protein
MITVESVADWTEAEKAEKWRANGVKWNDINAILPAN